MFTTLTLCSITNISSHPHRMAQVLRTQALTLISMLRRHCLLAGFCPPIFPERTRSSSVCVPPTQTSQHCPLPPDREDTDGLAPFWVRGGDLCLQHGRVSGRAWDQLTPWVCGLMPLPLADQMDCDSQSNPDIHTAPEIVYVQELSPE